MHLLLEAEGSVRRANHSMKVRIGIKKCSQLGLMARGARQKMLGLLVTNDNGNEGMQHTRQ